jgi:hypothetical protein
MKRILIAVLGCGLASSVMAASVTNDYSWENGGTILGRSGNLVNEAAVSAGSDPGTNNQNPTHDPALLVLPRTGSRMLQFDEDPHSGTPEAYVAWIKHVREGDEVTVSLWGWDSTSGANPKLRTWGHYTAADDMDDEQGSASGPGAYTSGTGEWSEVAHTWTIAAGKEALVIEARPYCTPASSSNSTTFWIDDLQVIAPDTATVVFPGGTVAPSGTVRYVSSYSGTDAGDGADPAAPCETIQYAVDQADSGDEIHIATFDVLLDGFPIPSLQSNACLYTGSGPSVIALTDGANLTLKGGYIYNHTVPGSPQWIQAVIPPVVDGQGVRRCLQARGADGDTNRVELLEFVNGSAGHGANVYAEGGSLQLVGTPIHDGVATGNGGGVYMSGVDFSVSLGSYSNLALPQMTGLLPIYSNRAARGGGLYLDGGYPVMTTVGIMDNTSTTNGGGIYINGGFPSVVGGAIQGNRSGGNGGAIYLSESVARVGGMIITSNRAVRGGAIYLDGPFAFSMETATLIANNYIQDNTSTEGKGGAVFFNNANVGVVNNIITGNSAAEGAAAYMYASSPRFLQNTIADNAGRTALHVTHSVGEGRWIITPEVRNPWPPYNVIVPEGSNYIAGIPVPSWPQLTNTIISGHTAAIHIDETDSDLLANKVEMGYTLWYANTNDIAGTGAGKVSHHHDIHGDPLYTSKGTVPGELTPYHIETNSPAVDSGVAVALTLPGTDLLLDIDAQLRPSGDGMDIGADEVVTDPFSVWFVPPAIARTVQPGEVVTNEHMLLNSGTQDDTYDIAASNNLWSGSVSPTVVSLSAQTYTSVTVIVTVPGDAMDGDTNITVVTAVSQADSNRTAIAVDTSGISTNTGDGNVRYAWHSSPNPRAPYTTPETAGHDIQTVVDVCVDGDTVLVYPGVYDRGGRSRTPYALTNRVCVTNAVVIRSLDGPTNTVIQGAADPVLTNGPAAVRGVCLGSGATLSGFWITDGHTFDAGDVTGELSGGGVFLEGASMFSNCVVEACTSRGHGGGLRTTGAAVLRNCTLRGNRSGTIGGGVYLSAGATLEDSDVILNRGGSFGGGLALASNSRARRCNIASNSASWGGGVLCATDAVVTRSVLRGNRGTSGGGAWVSRDAVLENSLIVGNEATSDGGGAQLNEPGATVRNCTVVDNEAADGGGLYCKAGSVIENTIMRLNTGGEWDITGGASTFSHCATAPDPGGAGNITDAPLFVNAVMGDYRIQPASPCLDAGTNVTLDVALDLDGTPRPLDGDADGVTAFDIGCYEVYNAAGDSDGDGMTDRDEGIADTDPTDANSVLRITAISNNSPVTVFFESSASRLYSLQGRSVLDAGDWADIIGKAGGGGTDSLTDTNAPPQGPFYRVRVRQP